MAPMRGFFVLFTVATLAACSQSGGSGSNTDFPTQSDPNGAFKAQRYIVKFTPSTSATELGQKADYLYKQAGFGAKIDPIMDSMYSVQFPAGATIKETVQSLGNSNNIQYVEPDYVVTAFHTPNDPMFAQQWAHKTIQSELAWDMGTGSKNVVVAIIDTGMDYTHPDLAPNVWTNPGEIPNNGIDDDGDGYVDDVHGWNFAANTADPMADDAPHYHGTHTAGSVGAVADNNVGVAGHSPNVTIMPLKFLTSSGSGNVSDAVRAIGFALTKKVRIISNSWGGSSFSQALCDAISYAKTQGVLFVVAAGNGNQQGIGQNNDSVPTYPANCPGDNVLSVASSNQSDTLSTFSNFGASSVQLAAPGENILSTKNGNQYQTMSGTSMATPLVAGVAAMMMALRPDLNYLQIKNSIINNVDVIPSMQGKLVSGGRINAYKAMKSIFAGPTPVPTPTPVTSPVPFPSPTPMPTPTPVPSPPSTGIANTPLLFGQIQYKLTNPNAQVPIDYDLSQFSNVSMVYLEISRTNTPFTNPNGTMPDPRRMLYAENPGSSGRFVIVPSQYFPTWGTYYFRVIPLNSQRQPVGRFSNSAVLNLVPQ